MPQNFSGSFKHLDFSPYALSEQSHFSNCQKCVPANTFWKVQRQGRNKSHLILLENTCKGQMQELNRQTLFNRGRNKPTQQAGWSNFPDGGREVNWLSDLESENVIRNTVLRDNAKPQAALKLSWYSVLLMRSWRSPGELDCWVRAGVTRREPPPTQTQGDHAKTMQIKLTTYSLHPPTGRQKGTNKLECDYRICCDEHVSDCHSNISIHFFSGMFAMQVFNYPAVWGSVLKK